MTEFESVPLDLASNGKDPSFDEPWQARAFALLAAFHAREPFAWSEWSAIFAARRTADETLAGDPGYYHSWVAALEKLLEEGGWVSQSDLEAAVIETRASWPHPAHAAHREPVAVDLARHLLRPLP